MWDVLLDAFLDTLKALPVLYLVYLIVGYFSHKNKKRQVAKTTSKFGPLVASSFGIVPQCGFASVMADLYSKKAITIGTLFAVFIATSDEAFAILILYPEHYLDLLALLGIKFISAVIFGYLIDFIFFKNRKKTIPYNGHDICDCSENHKHENHENNILLNNKNKKKIKLTNKNSNTNNVKLLNKNINEDNLLSNRIYENYDNEKVNKNNKQNINENSKTNVLETNNIDFKINEKNYGCSSSNFRISKSISLTITKKSKSLQLKCRNDYQQKLNENNINNNSIKNNKQIEEIEECHECHCCATNIFYDALLHTFKIAILLFVVGAILGLIINWIGENNIEKLFATSEIISIFVAGLVGLIPTCAISVVLVTFFTSGIITFSALVTGLCAGAGLGLVILFAKNHNIKQNIYITISLYIISVIIGLIVWGITQIF